MYMDRLMTVVLFSEHISSVNLIMFGLFQKYGFMYCLRSDFSEHCTFKKEVICYHSNTTSARHVHAQVQPNTDSDHIYQYCLVNEKMHVTFTENCIGT